MTVCGSGCTTASLQTALDSLAACGDTIQIKSTETQTGNFTITYRGCGANPITVTSDRAAWLPPAGARITPSHLANMAKITTPNSYPALADTLDSMGRPPAGWIFIGIAFSTTSYTYDIVGFNGAGTATGPSQIADNITFDRCYFYMPSAYSGQGVQNIMRGDATNLTVKNSFLGDGFMNGVESHGVSILTSAGPATITNNFVTTSSIPVFVGGAVPSYPTYLGNGMTTNYNYFWRPWKWNSDPAQPYAADYAAAVSGAPRSGPFTITNVSSSGLVTVSGSEAFYAGSVLTITGVGGCTVANAAGWRITPLSSNTFQLRNFPGCNSAYTSGGTVNEFALLVCTKNLGELKWGVGVSWQYNVGENSWYANQCGSQYVGFTHTLRTEWNSTLYSPIGTFSMSDTTHITWTGTYRIGGTGAASTSTKDLGICLSLPTKGTECHAIASFSGASLVTATPFSSAPSGALSGEIAYAASAQLKNVTIAHNVWKNADQTMSILAISPSNGVGDNGLGKNSTISQNLWYADNSYIGPHAKGLGMTAGENNYSFNAPGYTFDHNTFYFPTGMPAGAFVYLNGNGGGPPQPKFDSSTITNNLFGASASGGNGPFSGDGVADTIGTANTYFTNTSVKNNAIPGGSQNGSASGGNTVTGNIYTAWSDPFGGLASSRVFNVTSSSPYYHAGTDGASLGADFTQLPLVNNVKVTPLTNSATLEFDVSAPIADVKNSQVCVLEVSQNRNLFSDLGSYTVIPDLDPTVNQHSDLSTRSDVVVAGNHLTWPINGLSIASAYYGRLMCNGDTEWFTFQTPGASACDLNFDGIISVLDAQLAVNMSLGTTPCTANINGPGVCEVTTIQRVVNAALGGTCVTGP